MGTDNNVSQEINKRTSFPKNVRQIGKNDDTRRIYVEDYVITFMRQSAAYNSNNIFILLGNSVNVEDSFATFVNGAIRVEGGELLIKENITKETWDKIYYKIQNYFEGNNIIGWGCMSQEVEGDNNFNFMLQKFSSISRKNFPGNDKIFIHYNLLTQEENIYIPQNNELKQSKGYYIYYERNDAMQEYMMMENGSSSDEKDFKDDISGKIRTTINQNEEKKNEKHGIIKKGKKISIKQQQKMYTSVLAMAAIALVIIAAKAADVTPQKISQVFSGHNEKQDNYVKNINANLDDLDTSKAEDETLGNMTITQVDGQLPKALNLDDKNNKIKDSDKSIDKNDNNQDKNDEKKEKNSLNSEDNKDKDIDKSKNDNKDKDVPKNKKDNKDEDVSNNKNTSKDENVTKSKNDNKDAQASNDDSNYVKEVIASDKSYTVKKGDTLGAISRKLYGDYSKIQDICILNDIQNEDMIHEGDKIILPR